MTWSVGDAATWDGVDASTGQSVERTGVVVRIESAPAEGAWVVVKDGENDQESAFHEGKGLR